MLFKLIDNENLKIYRRVRTWILVTILFVATLLVAIVIHSSERDDPNWKASLISSTAAAQQRLDRAKSHMPAATVQEAKQQIALNQYYIEHNIDPHRTTGWKFAITASHLSALLIAFIVVIAGDVVASEFSSGTIKMLLTQTATRFQILLSKYLSALLFALFMTAVMFILSLLVGGVFFGFGGIAEPHLYADVHTQIQQMNTSSYLLMTYGFLFIQIVMTVTIAFMVSAIFRSSALAITISILAFLVGDTLVAVLSSYSWVKYILFANTDLSQYVEGGPHIQGLNLGFSITMLVIYFIVMNVLSFAVFMKRDVAYT